MKDIVKIQLKMYFHVQNLRICGKIRIHSMYEIVKMQWKIVYIRSIEIPNSWKNSNSLNVQNRQNSMEN